MNQATGEVNTDSSHWRRKSIICGRRYRLEFTKQ